MPRGIQLRLQYFRSRIYSPIFGRRRLNDSRHQPFEIERRRPFDEFDRDAVGQQADDAADAGADRERHADGRLQGGRHRNA